MRSITVNDGMTSILLGRKGENEATKIIFDISDWIEEYPQATFALINQKPNSTTEYPVVISQPRDGKVSWVVGGNELLTEGYGQCTLEAVEGNVVAKRHIWRTRILTAMGEPGEFPEPWESWLTEFTRLKGEAEDAQEAAEDAAEDSEAWAVGKRGGVDVDDEDPTYHNNSKYYSEAAQTALNEAIAEAEAAADAAETAQGKAEDAQEAAEDAQADAEAAQAAAELAKSTAETAASTATTAAGNAATSASAAASSASAAANAKTAAETAQSAAATSASTANTARAQTENLLAAAITAKNAAETAQGKAEDAQDAAETAQTAAETAQTETPLASANTAKKAADTAQDKAEDAQDAAETAQTAAETAQGKAEDAQEAAEAAQEAAEEAAEEALETVESKAPAIYEEASGAIVSIPDGAGGMKVKTLEVAIEPVQDLHGYDNPWPAGGGKNLIPVPYVFSSGATVSGVTATYDAFGVITGNGTGNGDYNAMMAETSFSAGTYTFHAIQSNDNTRIVLYKNRTAFKSHAKSDSPLTFTLSEDAQLSIRIVFLSGYSFSNATIKPYLAQGSSFTEWSPYENVCPISGWDSANVSRTGKNLFDASKVTYGYWLSGKWNTDGWWCGILIPCEPGRKISVSGNPTVGGVNGVWLNQFIDPTTGFISSFSYVGVTTFTAPTGAYGFWLPLYRGNDWSALQIEYGSSATAYEAFSGSTAEYEFPEAAKPVYGAKMTIWQDGSGALVVNEIGIDGGDLNWSKVTGSNYRSFKTNLNPAGHYENYIPTIRSSIYKSECNYTASVSDDNYVWIDTSTTFAVKDVSKASLTSTEFKDAMSGVQFVYELATPVTYQLTNQQVLELLKGNNMCFADCGPVSLEYSADTRLYIEKLTKPTEDDMIANNNIASGKFFMINNTMYLSSAAIASGEAIVPGTNCTEISLADALNNLSE